MAKKDQFCFSQQRYGSVMNVTQAILNAIMAPRTQLHQEIHFTVRILKIRISPFISHSTMSAIALPPTSSLLNTTDEDCRLNFNGEGYCGSYVKFYHRGNAVKLVDDLIHHESSTSAAEDIIFTYARQIWSGGIVFLVVAFLVWTGMGVWSYRNMNMNIRRRTVSLINRDIVTVPRWKRHMPVLVALASTIGMVMALASIIMNQTTQNDIAKIDEFLTEAANKFDEVISLQEDATKVLLSTTDELQSVVDMFSSTAGSIPFIGNRIRSALSKTSNALNSTAVAVDNLSDNLLRLDKMVLDYVVYYPDLILGYVQDYCLSLTSFAFIVLLAFSVLHYSTWVRTVLWKWCRGVAAGDHTYAHAHIQDEAIDGSKLKRKSVEEDADHHAYAHDHDEVSEERKLKIESLEDADKSQIREGGGESEGQCEQTSEATRSNKGKKHHGINLMIILQRCISAFFATTIFVASVGSVTLEYTTIGISDACVTPDNLIYAAEPNPILTYYINCDELPPRNPDPDFDSGINGALGPDHPFQPYISTVASGSNAAKGALESIIAISDSWGGAGPIRVVQEMFEELDSTVEEIVKLISCEEINGLYTRLLTQLCTETHDDLTITYRLCVAAWVFFVLAEIGRRLCPVYE